MCAKNGGRGICRQFIVLECKKNGVNKLYYQYNKAVTAKRNMSCIQMKIRDYRGLSIL